MTLVPMTGPLEAILFAAGSEGLAVEEIADLLELDKGTVLALCKELSSRYEEVQGGLELLLRAGRWKLVTRPEHSVYLERMATVSTTSALSSAALEVLAIVAYRQPVSRAEIESVRGVQSDRAVSTLVHRRLIQPVGRLESPGRPMLYGTTDFFLDSFGLVSLDELPPLPEDPETDESFALFQLGDTLAQD